MKKLFFGFMLASLLAAGCNQAQQEAINELSQPQRTVSENSKNQPTVTQNYNPAAKSSGQNQPEQTPNQQTGPKIYSNAELLAMADNKYSDGSVPLGDYKYVTDQAKKGYVFLCNVHKDNPGSMVNGPWMGNGSWNYLQKVTVDGSVKWSNAKFSNTVSGSYRTLAGNDLPINHTTGIFPVQSSDDAYKYDKNPNTISAQTLSQKIPANPTYSQTPYCMGGEVGIMLSGVALFNAFDAGLRDAPAHELQDSCSGHPQGSGEYHYHSLSSCFKDTSETTVLGYAYDGFPITGAKMADKKFLTTEDLDECHGLSSEIILDGKKVTTYHYVMTVDFPYSASCFRGKPATTGPSAGGPSGMQNGQGPSGQQGNAEQQSGPQTNAGQMPPGGNPPQEAITACQSKQTGSSCSFTSPMGDQISGTCQTPPNSSLACVPSR